MPQRPSGLSIVGFEPLSDDSGPDLRTPVRITTQAPRPTSTRLQIVSSEPAASGLEKWNSTRKAPAEDAPDDDWAMYIGDTLRDSAIGAAKSLMRQGIRGGELLRRIPGVNALDNLMTPIEVEVEPTNTAQRVGGNVFEAAQVLAPSGAITKLGMKAAQAAPAVLGRVLPRAGVEAAAAGGLAALQGHDPATAAGVGAAIPVVGAVARWAAPALKHAAAQQTVQALGPTKERFKAMAERIATDVLKRGLGGSRETLQAQAAEMVGTVGQQIDDAIAQYGARKVGTQPILDALEQSKAAFRTTRTLSAAELAQAPRLAQTAREVAPGVFAADVVLDARPLKQLSQLQGIITELGPSARVDQLVAVRRAWDKVVADAGGFAHRAGAAIGVPLKDQSEAWAKREATGAIRRLLDADVPELTVINREYAFWKTLDDVLSQTLKRTQPQGPGLLRAGAEAAGQVVGGMAGSGGGVAGTVGGAFALGKLSAMASQVFRSPRWQLASAKMRDRLAEAIASGDVSEMATAFGRISANRGAATMAASSARP